MTTLRTIPKPKKGEYPPYSRIYMELLQDDGLVLQHMKDNFIKIKKFIYGLPEEMLYHRYAEGKWSIKEILVHIIDDERIFAYRALRYARFDKTELNGFEQDDYAFYSDADQRSLENIFEEYEAVRNATIAMFNGFPEEAFMRDGTSVGNINNRTVRALAYHIAGHELRHIKIIKERYLNMATDTGVI
ncbi:DinB family protein [Flavobacterium humi]|uniref:DinB family protein n=1 Tax=Flavobacterium humi TaxID=2562683 RepID=A0A4Z0LBA3_9FLAO|nr:DinB family protein [Flavobacterium humi]TGD59098.1 DinB family protein [Flavobacterium humi]